MNAQQIIEYAQAHSEQAGHLIGVELTADAQIEVSMYHLLATAPLFSYSEINRLCVILDALASDAHDQGLEDMVDWLSSVVYRLKRAQRGSESRYELMKVTGQLRDWEDEDFDDDEA